jgi:hypothetical protein
MTMLIMGHGRRQILWLGVPDDISAHFNDCTMSSGIRRAASISAARAMMWDVNSRMPSSTLLF